MSGLELAGTWRLVGGVWRYSEDVTTDEVADLRSRMRPTKRERIDVHDYIACPTCLARCDERCRTSTGSTIANHPARLTSVRCPCGERLAPRKLYCEPCRVVARKQTYRLREVRQPTAERRAS